MHIKRKIDSASFFLVIIASCIILRLFYIQIQHSGYFIQQSQKNFLRVAHIAPLRGTIFDRKCKPIATNRPVHAVYWQGTGNRQLSPEQNKILSFVTNTLGDTKTDFTVSQITATEKLHRKKLLAYDIPHHTLCVLAEGIAHNTNIIIETDVQRFYPYGTYASHIIGY